MRVIIAAGALALLGCATPTSTVGASPPTPVSSQEILTMANPYDLADKAYAAAKNGDQAAWKELTGQDALPAVDLSGTERVRSLYFQGDDTKEIAAVIRFARGGDTAVWLHLVRATGGFAVKGLQETPENPDISEHVEGL